MTTADRISASRAEEQDIRISAPNGSVAYVVGNLVALLCGLFVAYVALLYGHHITSNTIKTGDFIAFYSGSNLVVEGHGAHLYDFVWLSHFQTSLLHPLLVRTPILLPYLYPPYTALLLAPVGALPYAGGYALWLLVNCFLLVTALGALERYAGVTERRAMVARMAAICSLPVILALLNGQASIAILAALTVCFFATRSGRDGLAGAALAFALIKPQYILPLLLVFLVLSRWRLLAAFGLTSLVLLVTPILILGSSVTGGYVHTLMAATTWTTQYGFNLERNDSLLGFVQLLLPAPTSAYVLVLLCLAAVSALIWCARRSLDIDRPFGLAVVVGLLISPHVLAHDLVLLLIPLAVALHYRRPASRRFGSLLVLGYLSVFVGYWLVYAVPLQLCVPAMTALGLTLAWPSVRRAPLRDTSHVVPRSTPRAAEAAQ